MCISICICCCSCCITFLHVIGTAEDKNVARVQRTTVRVRSNKLSVGPTYLAV